MSSSNLPALRPSGSYYGIQLSDSEYRTWKPAGENASNLAYHWERMNANIYASLQDTIVAVTKKHPNDPPSTIKNMAKTVRQTRQLHVNDHIFGLDHQNIEKVGFIAHIDVIDNQEVAVKVNWVSEQPLGEVIKPIFHEDSELQPLRGHELQVIERQFPDQLQVIYAKLPSRKEQFESYRILEEPPVKFIEERDVEDTPKEDKGGLISVFFGTNRNAVNAKNDIPDFGDEETDEISYGICDVQLPEGHRQGELERPGKFLWLFPLPENEHMHVVLKSVKVMGEADFLTDFAQRIADNPKQHALLFVHGYNTSFKEAAYRTAQLAWDIPFVGYAGFYSWPSAAKLLPYPSDGAAARSSVFHLKAYIKNLLEIPGLEQLHIIAHSMGGLILTLSLKDLQTNAGMTKQLEKVSQLILGAPDIDQKEFRKEILPYIEKVGHRRTLYASDHDLALEWSSAGRTFRERLGQIGDDIFVAPGLDTVEASNLKTPSSHSYLFESKILLSDIYFLITQGLAPAERRLREIKNLPVNYWLFPK
ncbi:MAG: alpha/beta hydrolase [Sphingobacteriales bacterium]